MQGRALLVLMLFLVGQSAVARAVAKSQSKPRPAQTAASPAQVLTDHSETLRALQLAEEINQINAGAFDPASLAYRRSTIPTE